MSEVDATKYPPIAISSFTAAVVLVCSYMRAHNINTATQDEVCAWHEKIDDGLLSTIHPRIKNATTLAETLDRSASVYFDVLECSSRILCLSEKTWTSLRAMSDRCDINSVSVFADELIAHTYSENWSDDSAALYNELQKTDSKLTRLEPFRTSFQASL